MASADCPRSKATSHRREVQGLSDRLLPHRHRRGADRSGQAHLFVAIDRTSKFAFVSSTRKPRTVAADFLRHMSPPCPTRSTPSSPTTAPTSPIPPANAGAGRDQGDLASRELFRAHAFGWACAHERHRSPTDKAEASLDKRTGRADEPDHRGGHRQTLLLRNPRSTRAASGHFVAHTISPDCSRPSKASRPTSSSAKRGHTSRNASRSIHSTKCRD